MHGELVPEFRKQHFKIAGSSGSGRLKPGVSATRAPGLKGKQFHMPRRVPAPLQPSRHRANPQGQAGHQRIEQRTLAHPEGPQTTVMA